MIKRALSTVAGFFCAALSLHAQGTPFFDGLAPRALQSDVTFASLALGERSLFSFPAAVGWMDPGSDFLPPFHPGEPRRSMPSATHRVAAWDGESSDMLDGARASRFDFGGEVGFLYGRFTGKGGGDLMSTYIIGEVGNDKFHITVGASHSEWDGRAPSRRR